MPRALSAAVLFVALLLAPPAAAGQSAPTPERASDAARPAAALTRLDVPPVHVMRLPDGGASLAVVPPASDLPFALVALDGDGAATPFPNALWSRTPDDGGEAIALSAVTGLHAEADGRVWMLDAAGASPMPPKVLVWDAAADSLARILWFPEPATLPISQVAGLAVDPARDLVVAGDFGTTAYGDGSMPALLVMNTATGAARRMLEGCQTLAPARAEGERVAMRRLGDWLEVGTDDQIDLFRIPLDWLTQLQLTDAQRAQVCPGDGVTAEGG
jgi:hypothetical protein